MNLVTACPECGTSFHVKQDQLIASQGKVRCGKCDHVFDALSRLSDVSEQAHPVHTPAAPSSASIANPPQYTPATTPTIKLESRSKKRSASPWLLVPAILFFLLLALLQTIYYLRTPIAAHQPQLRPHLEAACTLIGCKVPLPRQPELLAIIDSDLQEDADREGLVHLSVTIVNNAPFIQAYPVLELTLTNNYDKPVVRRPFTPQEYVPRDNTRQGLMPGEEIEVRLPLLINDDVVAGYRLFVTYP